jgi:hypothetical protein
MLNPQRSGDSQPSFFHTAIQTDDLRMMILSGCTRCGESRVVSQHDGSLDEWESTHCCSDQVKVAPISQ